MNFLSCIRADLAMGVIEVLGGLFAAVGIISTLSVIFTRGPDDVDTRGPQRRFPK